MTKYRRFRHGEAVAYGMLVAARAGVARGALAERDRKALADLIASLGPLPPIADVSDERRCSRRCSTTRRWSAGALHFVLPTGDRRDDDRGRRDGEGMTGRAEAGGLRGD